MADVYLGLGSNLEEPAEQLREAVRRLSEILSVERLSSVYRTEPVGLRAQPFFLNAVVRARTELAPGDVLRETRAIEDAMGRQREVALGPRTIDIDVLLHGSHVVNGTTLTLPHPRMHERRFVLAPLAEIASELRLPELDRTVSELLSGLPKAEAIERIALPDWPPPPRPI